MSRHFLILFLCLSMALIMPATAQAADTPPDTLIQNQVDVMLSILSDSELTQPENRHKLKQTLIKEFESLFVFREMTLRALGSHGRNLSKKQVDNLTEVFKNLLEEIYASRLTSHLYNTESTMFIDTFEVTGVEERGPYARVNSYVVFQKGTGNSKETTKLKINYKMVNRGQGWHIYDVEIEGVSLIANYRSQFSNILANHSYETLKQRLRAKLEEQRKQDESDDGTPPEKIEAIDQSAEL